MKTVTRIALFFSCLLLTACGGAGGTETGTTDTGNEIDTSVLGSRVEAVASALLPNIPKSSTSGFTSIEALTYGTNDHWATYRNSDNVTVLTDIFGGANEEPRVVTRVRVLLDHLKGKFQDIFSKDSKIDCTGAVPLTADDSITISFYGAIANGTQDNRYFDCVKETVVSELDQETTIYGKDKDGVVRLVDMSDKTSTNSESTAIRGDQVRIRAVRYATYAEVQENGSKVSYIDLHFAHGSSYNGADKAFSTSDDVIFKSRSRITGRAVLDNDGNPTIGLGDFTVTKYDVAENGASPAVTQTIGRGNYGGNQYSLFRINSNMSSLRDLGTKTFCLQTPAGGSGLPSDADSLNCGSLESATAWEGVFPFSLTPEISQGFDAAEFFEGDDTDMIANDGGNFTIPDF
ncbi:MAG: hypothetical protein HYS22_01690 [Deltaproteobacteria bacterium]|nr:hypothetical protein [Deltaproteobacteria bacterium]